MSTTVIAIKKASLKFAATQAGLTSGPDYTCQINSAKVTANPNLQTVPATFCGPESQAPAATGWQLDITYLQDWGAAQSLSQYLFDNDATRAFFEITPTDPDAPSCQGECWLVAGDYLGDAGTPLQASATMPLLAKPTISATTTMATQEQPVPV